MEDSHGNFEEIKQVSFPSPWKYGLADFKDGSSEAEMESTFVYTAKNACLFPDEIS